MSRPRLDEDVVMDVYTIRISPKQARMARRLGEGNLSEGVRKAIDDFAQTQPATLAASAQSVATKAR